MDELDLDLLRINKDLELYENNKPKFCKIVFSCKIDSDNTDSIIFGFIIGEREDICNEQKEFIKLDIYNSIVYEINNRLELKKEDILNQIDKIISDKSNFIHN